MLFAAKLGRNQQKTGGKSRINTPIHRSLGEGGKQPELLAACEFYFQGLKARKKIAQGKRSETSAALG
jgi:hypothetical protein